MAVTLSTTTQSPPTPAQIDALVSRYTEAQAVALASSSLAKDDADVASAIKSQLVELVESHGFRHTEKSKRLCGLHNTATTTTGTRLTVNSAAVDTFRAYLAHEQLPEVAARFFSAHVSYSLVDGATEVLKTLDLGKRVRAKVASLIGLCFEVKLTAPSLKVEVVVPEKATRPWSS